MRNSTALEALHPTGNSENVHRGVKKESYATDAQYIDLASGDVILWGGINRMLVHNVEEVLPGTAPAFLRQLVKNVRYNFTFRDCSNITGREEEFKYYIPAKGDSE